MSLLFAQQSPQLLLASVSQILHHFCHLSSSIMSSISFHSTFSMWLSKFMNSYKKTFMKYVQVHIQCEVFTNIISVELAQAHPNDTYVTSKWIISLGCFTKQRQVSISFIELFLWPFCRQSLYNGLVAKYFSLLGLQ